MISLPLLLLALGPELDPFMGGEVGAAERTTLPSGRFLGEVADLWFVELVSMQNGDGGMAHFDPLYLSSHGRSWTLFQHTLNGLSLDDPARSGTPLFELPFHAWDELTYRSLWTPQPGFHATLLPTAPHLAWARASAGRDLGGGTWVPAGLMDREPAATSGPVTDRRALRQAVEVAAEGGASGKLGALRLLFEHVEHSHRYPTLRDLATGEHLPDDAQRTSLLALGRLDALRFPVHVLLGWQAREREHEGAQFRWPAALTLDTQARAALGQMAAHLDRADYRLTLAAGVTWRRDDERVVSDAPRVSDVEGEWSWMLRPRFGERTERVSLQSRAELSFRELPLALSLTASHAQLATTPRLGGLVTGITYAAAENGDTSLAMTVYDPARRAREWLSSVRLSAEGERALGRVRLSYALGFDHSAVGTPGRTRVSFASPAVGMGLRTPLWGGVWFTLLRHEPDGLTSQVASFVDPTRPGGERYAWADDGDGVPELGEEGAQLNRTGGDSHSVAADLARPTSTALAFGWRSPTFGAFAATLTGVTRWQLDPFTVRLTGPAAASYSPVIYRVPGGDGRGEERVPGVGQLLTLYDRASGTEGTERYALGNQARDHRYIGAELKLATVETTRWFVNLGAAGYWNIGAGGGFGAFPDRNDPGIIDESGADPNARVAARGRFDQDRSFAIKLLAGLTPLEGLTTALAIRYRDGQPFTRIWVAQMPQGPTPVMAVWRGGPRHTFHMVVDTRVRYAFAVERLELAVALDLYNLLGSGTELLEHPVTGADFRESIEMVPGRAGLATLELGL